MSSHGSVPSDESDTTPGHSEVFSDHASDTDSSTEPSVFDSSSECEDEPEDELVSEDEEEQLPPEYYLHEAESLDVSQLRQKRYSPNTQRSLDDTQYFWDQ